MTRFEMTVLTAAQKSTIDGVLITWQADDEEGCGCRFGLDYLDDWLDGDGREALLCALDGERDALPAAERYVASVLMADAKPLPTTLADLRREEAEFTIKPFLDRAPSWLLERDSYARWVFDEACLRSAAVFSDGHGHLPNGGADLREWWEVLNDYLRAASAPDAAETDAEREDAEAVRKLAEHFQARFAVEFPSALPAVKAALGSRHVLDNLGRAGPEGAAAAQAIKDRLTATLLNDVAVSNLDTSDGEPVTSAAQLADSFGADGVYERYDQVRSGLREWLNCDMDLGGELLEIVERHVGKVTDDEDERQDIGRSLVDESVVYALSLIERWSRDEAAATEADLHVAGLKLAAVAEAVADGRMTVEEAQRQMPSTSQRCVLALVAGEPGAAEEPYDSAAEAWRRLDDRQRALVTRLAPGVVERWGLK